jgi:hypothetical protein
MDMIGVFASLGDAMSVATNSYASGSKGYHLEITEWEIGAKMFSGMWSKSVMEIGGWAWEKTV